MTSNKGVELPWKPVAKGSRSSTRRGKTPIKRVAASDIESEDKSSTHTLVAGESKRPKVPPLLFVLSFLILLGNFSSLDFNFYPFYLL